MLLFHIDLRVSQANSQCLYCYLQGWTPLHSAVSAGHNDVVQDLISLGADVNAANSSGQTPLHYAVSPTLTSADNSQTTLAV